MPFHALFSSAPTLVDKKKRISYTRILSYLYKNGSTPIAKLAKELHSSVPSITSLLSDLIKNHWVLEKGAAKTKSGRRPVFYDLNADKNSILIIDINLYETHFIFTNLRNKISTNTSYSISIDDPNFLKEISKEIENLLRINKKPWAIGLSSPGLIESTSGLNHSHPNLNIDNHSFAHYLSEKHDIPVFSMNDTRASLLGEHHYGLARDKKNVLLVNLDWGVGLGILHNGIIVKGSDGFAGELGHVQIYPDGELCNCGKIGCLETVASASTLIRKANAGIQNGKATILSRISNDISLQDIIQAANKGDEFSIDIIYEVGRELGKGLSTAVHLFNPELIILDGILKTAGELIISALKQSIQKYCLGPFKKNLEVVVSPMSADAKVFGCKSFVFQKMMEFYTN